MRDIAAAAGMSAAFLYRYLTDHDQLFVEAFYRESHAVSQGLSQFFSDGEGSRVERLLGHDNFFQMMAHFMINGGMSAEAIERFNQTERSMLDVFEDMFRDLGVPADNLCLLAQIFCQGTLGRAVV